MFQYAIPYVVNLLSGMRKDEDGQGLVEYALILVLVSIAAFAALQLLGTTISGVFTQITGDL